MVVQEKVDHVGIVALVTGTPITALLVRLMFPTCHCRHDVSLVVLSRRVSATAKGAAIMRSAAADQHATAAARYRNQAALQQQHTVLL